jgi:hypothetical protein
MPDRHLRDTRFLRDTFKKCPISKAFSLSIVTIILNFSAPIVVGVNSVLTAQPRAAIVADPTLDNRELS